MGNKVLYPSSPTIHNSYRGVNTEGIKATCSHIKLFRPRDIGDSTMMANKVVRGMTRKENEHGDEIWSAVLSLSYVWTGEH